MSGYSSLPEERETSSFFFNFGSFDQHILFKSEREMIQNILIY